MRIPEGGFAMNWDEVSGKWNQVKGYAKVKMGQANR
jgi:uncharacterized protein YjbJ (UPF0337 family)